MGRLRRTDVAHGDTTDAILAAFFDVYGTLGHGYLESVYRRAMLVALHHLGVRAATEVPVTVMFRGVDVGRFRVDLVVEETVAVELKAARAIERAHEAQLLNLLRSTRLEVGLLLNFGPKPEFRRRAFSNERMQVPRRLALEDDQGGLVQDGCGTVDAAASNRLAELLVIESREGRCAQPRTGR